LRLPCYYNIEKSMCLQIVDSIRGFFYKNR